ncbi:MAG: ankyrin repeat domain-containing protein [Bryobacteraceae bacterium]
MQSRPMLALFLAAMPILAKDLRPDVRDAAQRAIASLETPARAWSEKQQCISCHTQALPMMAVAAARSRGLTLDEKVHRAHAAKVFALFGSIDMAVQDPFLIDPAFGEGYALLAAHAAGIEPSLTTAIYARRIANWQRADGSWNIFDSRPPSASSRVAATAIAARAVSLYMPHELPAMRRDVMTKAARWLAAQRVTHTEDLSFKLMGLAWCGAAKKEIARAARDLRAAQMPDGGWAQYPGAATDAYATGQALVTLTRAGGLRALDAAGRRGIEYLMRTQAPDGAWLVKTRIHTRAPVSPPYFETGFPYGKDQIISTAATAWAAMALMEALPPATLAATPLPVPEATPVGEQPWMRAALFGPADAMNQMEPNAATAGGTTAMMMAVHDAAKVEILARRGASMTGAAKSGFTPLMVAATYRNNAGVVRFLLDHGAAVNVDKGVMFNASPLTLAAMGGNPEMVEILLDAGADITRPMLLVGVYPVRPLDLAVVWDDATLLRMFAAKGAEIDAKSGLGMTPLSIAMLKHNENAARALLDLGASRDNVDKFGMKPADHAASIDFGDAGFVSRVLR